MRCLALLCACLLAGCGSMSGPEKLSMGCALADLVTTAYGLSQADSKEGHPGLAWAGGEGALALNAGVYVSFHFAARSVDRKAVWAIGSGVHCAAAGWNLSQILEN